MSAQYSNIVGIVGSSFRLGMGDNAPVIYATPEGQLYFNAPIQIKGRVEGQPYVPAEADDLVTLDVVQRLNSATYTDACNFARQLILQMGGTGGGEGGESGTPIIMQNAMPAPVIYETLKHGYSLTLGVLEREQYLHEVVLELEQIFTSTDDARYEIAIGTIEKPSAFVDWFEITAAQKSVKFDVLQTVHDLTEVKLFCRDWVDPNPWIQRILNPHDCASVAIKSYDAKQRIYEVTIHADNVPPYEDIVHVDLFGPIGETLTGKGYLDFGIPIKLKKNGHYRISQINNPALAEFYGTDPDVDENDGVWSKVTDIGPFPDNFDEDEGAQYFFLLGQSRGEDDWCHVYVYDLDAQDSDIAIWVFHIKNEIMQITTPEEPEIPEEATFEFHSISEGVMTSEKQEDGTYIVNLSGEILDKSSDLETEMPGISSLGGKFTWVTATFTGYTGRSFRFICQNPAYQYFYSEDSDIVYNDGVYYVDQTLEVPEDGTFSVEILVSDIPGDINIIVIGDPNTTQADLVTIANNLTFVDESELPDPPDDDDEFPAQYLHHIATDDEATQAIDDAFSGEDHSAPNEDCPDGCQFEVEYGPHIATDEEMQEAIADALNGEDGDDEAEPAAEIEEMGAAPRMMSARAAVMPMAELETDDRLDNDSNGSETAGLPIVTTGRARIRMIVF